MKTLMVLHKSGSKTWMKKQLSLQAVIQATYSIYIRILKQMKKDNHQSLNTTSAIYKNRI